MWVPGPAVSRGLCSGFLSTGNMRVLGDPPARAAAFPVSPGRRRTSIFARGFPSLVFCGGFAFAFAFLAEISHVHPQKLWLPRASTKKGGRVGLQPQGSQGRGGVGRPE